MCRAGQREGPLHLYHGSIWYSSGSDLELLQLRDASISKQQAICEILCGSVLLCSVLVLRQRFTSRKPRGRGGRLRGKF